ncbi:MAG TPA: hypothetical protein VGR67_16055 [Candidatus Polarisedimenticolia bacterium]|jgi:hypothetical protein|nr:hypothetical protein [Candidatus Polarisedimenticolia bacterium]
MLGMPIAPSGEPKGHHQERQLVVLVTRDPIERHGQHDGREAAEKREQDDEANVGDVLGDARELAGEPFGVGRAAHQDHAWEGDPDVEEEREAGDPSAGPASHLASSNR